MWTHNLFLFRAASLALANYMSVVTEEYSKEKKRPGAPFINID